MKNFKFSSLLLLPLLAVLAVLAACGGGGGSSDSGTSTPATPTLKSIAVTAANANSTIVINNTLQLTATGTYSDGSSKTLTGLTWATKSGAATVATVAASGIVTAKGSGTETITATSTADNISGSLNVTVIAPWTQVAAGGNQTIGLKADGKLYSWGSNIRGQLGDGSSTGHNTPVTVAGNSNIWKQVAVGEQFAVAIRTDGTLWAWGFNLNGQLGDGSNNDSPVPKQIGSDKTWTFVAAGKRHVAALKTGTGTTPVTALYTWGSNANGQLGDGTTIDKNKPTLVSTGTTATSWLAVAVGDNHTVAIQKDQTLWAWGDNSAGQIGNGATSSTAVSAPVQIGTAQWVLVAAGSMHTLAIKSDNTLWAWGQGGDGQVGNNGQGVVTAPVQIGTNNNWARVAGGVSHSVGVQNDGTLWAWGSNAEGQLGTGGTDSLFPVQVGTLNTWKAVSAGAAHTAAMNADNTLWTWGRNADGQLGNGSNTLSSVPVKVPY
ncbi:RCC1 domain-containing protein [Duganella callida]|uniref:BIG2 domain-containing protein n=1 Tax=Duganella callida TaxID=2561932 RepID=A0A4Y9SME9_9BURK|nr:RCC1 domain-containing protein [Duganella callida]TFW25756.1 hypothetical protein E4L98_08985 [Duganella callida]